MEAPASKAAMKPSMANLPLTVSGALPAKAMASPKVGAFGAGGGGGGVAALPSGAGTFGSSAARTATNLAVDAAGLEAPGGESEGGRGDGLGGEHTCLVEALVFEFVRRWATVGDDR